MDLGDPGRDDRFGYGLINAYTARVGRRGAGNCEPILSVNPAALNFGLFIEGIFIKVANSGGGDLKVDAINQAPTGCRSAADGRCQRSWQL